jgi:opacity protein-like surface antigen
MRIKVSLILAALALVSLPALAQNGNSEVSANFTGNYQKMATGFGIVNSATDSGGFVINYRYHFNRWSAVEVNYGYTRFTQFYDTGTYTEASAHEATFAYLFTFGVRREARLHPFVEAGAGALFFSPVNSGTNITGAATQNRAALLYGAGASYRLMGNLSAQVGYRGLVYTAPDFTIPGQVTNARTQMAEPYAGITFRF